MNQNSPNYVSVHRLNFEIGLLGTYQHERDSGWFQGKECQTVKFHCGNWRWYGWGFKER